MAFTSIRALPRGYNDTAAQPPVKALTTVNDNQKSVAGTYSNAAFGDLHVFTLNTDTNTLAKHASDTLQRIRTGIPFGQDYDRRPDYYGVYENETIFGNYLAIFHIGGATYWAEGHYFGLPMKDGEGVLDIAMSVRDSATRWDDSS